MRLFARSARRANFRLYLTQGFNPHPLIRIKKAIKLGIEGINQEAEFVLTERIDADSFKKRIMEHVPEGIEVENVEVIG
jgi:radical SAM-linked protein